jgi:hypothetical protein
MIARCNLIAAAWPATVAPPIQKPADQADGISGLLVIRP